MVDEVMVRRAAETAWTVYRAAHPGVDVQDSRRCLLERYLHRRREEREIDPVRTGLIGTCHRACGEEAEDHNCG